MISPAQKRQEETPRGAVFLDRDGVLNVDTGYPHRPAELQLVPGSAEAVAYFHRLGYLVIVATNQAGVAHGMYEEADVHRFHEALNAALKREGGAQVDGFYYSPWHPTAAVARYRVDHPDRKPAPGMILRGMAEWNVDPQRALMIGDRETDVQAAEAAGIKGYLFQGPNLFEFVKTLPLVQQTPDSGISVE